MLTLKNVLVVWGTLICFVGYSMCQTFTTSGESGTVCGDEGKKCLQDQAQCDPNTGRCVCVRNRYPIGRGQLNCYRNSEHFSELVNDPTVLTMNNQTVDLSLPCRFLVSHFTSGLENKNKNNIGKCTFKIYAFQHKDKGKMYVAGVDVALQLDYDSGFTYKTSVRQVGKADNGTYTYQVSATEGSFSPDGPWGTDGVNYNDVDNKIKVALTADKRNNIILLTARKCGVRLRFRGYDCITRRDQPIIPGLSLAISQAFPPLKFLSQNASVAMVPIDEGGSDIESSMHGYLDRRQTMVYRALMAGATQNQPEENPQCSAAVSFLEKCEDDQQLKEAFDNCLWMLKVPRFIRCFDDTISGEKIMGLFNNCTSIYCGSTRGQTTCRSVIDSIKSANCDTVKGYAMLDAFLAEDMCPVNFVINDRRRRHLRRFI